MLKASYTFEKHSTMSKRMMGNFTNSINTLLAFHVRMSLDVIVETMFDIFGGYHVLFSIDANVCKHAPALFELADLAFEISAYTLIPYVKYRK